VFSGEGNRIWGIRPMVWEFGDHLNVHSELPDQPGDAVPVSQVVDSQLLDYLLLVFELLLCTLALGLPPCNPRVEPPGSVQGKKHFAQPPGPNPKPLKLADRGLRLP